MRSGSVPFFRPEIADSEVEEVISTLRSGWLTTGPRTAQFESLFADATGGRFSVALSSCTAALHLAVEALGLKAGQAVLVPTMTFAATAEVVRYMGATPVLVDCDADSLNIDLKDAAEKLRAPGGNGGNGRRWAGQVVGVMPVHVGGLMADVAGLKEFAKKHALWIVEDAAHAFPAAWRPNHDAPWQRCGERTAAVSCFSFYANKTITTGEGGMAVTDSEEIAARIRMMSLHGLSKDAWSRYSKGGSWDYRIVAPGYKYNITDIAAAIGIHQLARAEEMRRSREEIALRYREAFSSVDEIELPPEDANRIHSRHLFPIRLRLHRLRITRNEFIEKLKERNLGCSVHWRPLHMHPYYQETFGWKPEDCPKATAAWERLISLPIFSGMLEEEIDYVISVVADLCRKYRKRRMGAEVASDQPYPSVSP